MLGFVSQPNGQDYKTDSQWLTADSQKMEVLNGRKDSRTD